MSTSHTSVLLQEVVDALRFEGEQSQLMFDGTCGGGGHTAALLELSERVSVLATDRDRSALERSRERLERYGSRVHLAYGTFVDFYDAWRSAPDEFRRGCGQEGNEEPVFQGMILDLGISSDQLDDPERGFSFRLDGPLDMRMNRERGKTAADILNSASERDLKLLFLKGGVDRGLALRLSREIPRRRPFAITKDFADLCAELNRPRRGEPVTKNPATVPFQALRIAVNEELSLLEEFLERAPSALAVGGRLAVISFHSLEDKVVTQTMRRLSRPGLLHEPAFGKLLTRHAVVPGEVEMQGNPRARSARLRVFERTGM